MGLRLVIFISLIAGVSAQSSETACPEIFKVTNIVKSGQNIEEVREQLRRLPGLLNPTQAAWLGANGYTDVRSTSTLRGLQAVQKYIDDFLEFDLLAVADFDTAVVAFTGTGCTDVPPACCSMLVNRAGIWFRSNSAYQVLALVHEIAHALRAPGFKNDWNNPSAQRSNQELLQQKFPELVHASRN